MRSETIDSRAAASAAVLYRCLCGLAIVLAVVLVFLAPCHARADGGVTLVRVWAGSYSVHDVWPGPVDSYNLTLEFDKNVSYSDRGDDAFVRENLARVYVVDSAGRRVDSIVVEGASGPADKTVIYVRATEWLLPLSEYTVVAEAGIRAKNGTDISAVEYRTKFVTGAESPIGLSVYQIAALAIGSLALAIGLAVSAVRKMRSSEG